MINMENLNYNINKKDDAPSPIIMRVGEYRIC